MKAWMITALSTVLLYPLLGIISWPWLLPDHAGNFLVGVLFMPLAPIIYPTPQTSLPDVAAVGLVVATILLRRKEVKQ